MLYPNDRTATLDAWAAIFTEDQPVLVKDLGPLGAPRERVQELAREALGPGFTEELRADLIDFYNLVRRVADWMGLYRSLRGFFWETDRARDRRESLGNRIYKAICGRQGHSWDAALAASLDFVALRGRRIGWLKRRRARHVLNVLGLEFVSALKDHRLLVSRMFSYGVTSIGDPGAQEPAPGLVAMQDYYLDAYGLVDYGYSWMTTVLWEAGNSHQEMLSTAFFELRDLEAALAKRGFRDFEPWIEHARPTESTAS